ncbi:gephyrin-like molybdotransferase Glp [Donghicola mangrovi]|uniref:Molybdopterin molybdenumtransferase n=1 Tax=Donghicola mangrovi TaxID=2729614 RepID=A0A850Q9J1_9RHOB|nr:gephyrin-like molybdotransferase Glp [Donghicola mangrovi]NVO23628.1 molybdopterin molybdotransferase MoeA [Donghicola mangrovi]
MIPVAEALDRLFALVRPLEAEDVALTDCAGRVLARTVKARRTQPPFAASAMDGYAVVGDLVAPGAKFTVIGEAAAGHAFDGVVALGQAVRIFTGAPIPSGASHVVIQEDVERTGDTITLKDNLDSGSNIRPAGGDFVEGAELAGPRRLSPAHIALAAAMNLPKLPVTRRPIVAIMATGNELVMPGETPKDDQIIASNNFGLKALLESRGAEVRMLPIARDTHEALRLGFDLARGADLVVTIGGASVGDHDLVAPVAADLGMETSFYKIAMRPGKPLMAGKLGDMAMVGLPGNPVSALVCGQIFLCPLIDVMLGLPAAAAPRLTARLAAPLAANGPREHYMRARVEAGEINAYDNQDSSLLGILADANALLVRPVRDPAQDIGATVEYIAI